MVARYANIDTADLASLPEVTISAADSRLLGVDFLFKGHDHTLGNMLQTWLVENHLSAMEGSGKTPVTYAGYVIPHPLRDEMLLRIGVADGKAATARKALAEACAGCAEMFRQLKISWITGTSTATGKSRMELLRETGMDIRGTIVPGAGAGAGAKPLRGAPAAMAKRATTTVAGAGAGAGAPAAKSTAGVEAAMKALQTQVSALSTSKAT
jgi:DNA-directed RNA polymerase subunit L